MLCHNCGHDNISGVDTCESCGSDLAGTDLPEAGKGFRGKLLSDEIGKMKISSAITVDPETTIADAIKGMREAKRGCVLVARDGNLVGIFNERHVLTRVVRKNIDAATTPISQVMSPDPLRLSPHDPPAYAVHCMVVHDFRHLPVVDGEDVLGYISVRNILAYLNDEVLPGS